MEKKIEVGIDSNPRGKEITTQEIEQVIRDFIAWLKNNNAAAKLQGEGKEEDIKMLQDNTKFPQLHEGLKCLIKGANGGCQLHDSYISLSVKDIIEINEVNAVSGFWKNNYLTFAQDLDENYLVLENDTGKVISWNKDEGIQEPISENIGLYLEKLRNQVLKKELEYIEEVGLVENQN